MGEELRLTLTDDSAEKPYVTQRFTEARSTANACTLIIHPVIFFTSEFPRGPDGF